MPPTAHLVKVSHSRPRPPQTSSPQVQEIQSLVDSPGHQRMSWSGTRRSIIGSEKIVMRSEVSYFMMSEAELYVIQRGLNPNRLQCIQSFGLVFERLTPSTFRTVQSSRASTRPDNSWVEPIRNASEIVRSRAVHLGEGKRREPGRGRTNRNHRERGRQRGGGRNQFHLRCSSSMSLTKADTDEEPRNFFRGARQ